MYILMEYCGNGDLSTVIKQAQRHGRPIPEDTVWNYFMQILLALNYCHHPPVHGRTSGGTEGDDGKEARRAQILHRDLKPDNGTCHRPTMNMQVLITEDSVPGREPLRQARRLRALQGPRARELRADIRRRASCSSHYAYICLTRLCGAIRTCIIGTPSSPLWAAIRRVCERKTGPLRSVALEPEHPVAA